MSFRLATAIIAYTCMYAFCYLLAFLLRFDFNLPAGVFEERYLASLPAVLIVKTAACVGTREGQRRCRYTNLADMMYVVFGAVGVAITLYVLNTMGYTGGFIPRFVIPRSVIVIDCGLAILCTGLLRSAVRLTIENVRGTGQKRINTLIYGSDEAGISILRAIQSSPSNYKVVGFVEENAGLHRSMIAGTPVVALNRHLDIIARRFNATHVLLPGNMPGSKVRDLLEVCKDAELTAHVIPAIEEIVDGRYSLAIRDVTISDLLRREPTRLDMDSISGYIRGRRVLVSGGAGSIGSELCRQILQLGPSQLVVVDQSEFGVFSIEQELVSHTTETELIYAVRDIADMNSMSILFEETMPEIVFHAAAYKHVPLMESNPQEAIRNNIFGTKVMVDLADRFAVDRFVMISTDKAVRPTNIMGSTKLVAEKYLQSVTAKSTTQYITVRFGNVLNSVGSVVPTFRKQIEMGGPVTVTDPKMERFFMTIPEAVQLVMQAGAVGATGDILILDMGEPVRIVDLAKDMISLSGLNYPDDIDIEFTGIRPGEKMYEELFYGSEEGSKKVHDKIFCAPRSAVDKGRMQLVLSDLQRAIEAPNAEAKRILKAVVDDYVASDSTGQEQTGFRKAA